MNSRKKFFGILLMLCALLLSVGAMAENTVPEIKYSNGTAVVENMPDAQQKLLIAALYNGGILTEVKTKTVTAEDCSFDISEYLTGCTDVKLMLWDSFTEMAPAAEKVEANVEQLPQGILKDGEQYGWIMNIYPSDSGEDTLVKLMTASGESVFTCADTVEYWSPNSTEAVTLAKSEMEEALAAVEYIQVAVGGAGTPVRLIKYKVDSENRITQLYCASDASSVTNEDALRINKTNLIGAAKTGGLVSGYLINDGMTEIRVPKNADDMTNEKNYSFGKVKASDYAVPEIGSVYNYIVAEFSGAISPTVIIRFTESYNALADINDIDTNANNPVMIVNKIDESADEDGNAIYTVSGYTSGMPVSFTTTNNTALAEITTSSAIINFARDYAHKDLWNAQNGSQDADNPDAKFTDFLSKGDIVLYDGGERLLRLLDADDVYNVVQKEESAAGLLFGSFSPFIARNMFAFASLEDYRIDDDGAWIKLPVNGLSTMAFDESKPIDVIEINTGTSEVSIATESETASGLEIFDEETKTGDYIFARLANKGQLQELIAYRFTNIVAESTPKPSVTPEPVKPSILKDGEQYGWIMNVYPSGSGEDTLIKLMTASGESVFTCADTVEYWSPSSTEATTLAKSEMEEELAVLEYVAVKIAGTSTPVRLVKYVADDENRITQLYCAADASSVTNEDALRINKSNLMGVAKTGGLVSGYRIKDGMTEIRVPKNADDMTDKKNYSFGKVNAADYAVPENGSFYNYIVAEFSGEITPTVLIRFTESYNVLADINDIDTAANNPVMVVEDIYTGLDDDYNVIYTVSGYVNGAEASFMTTKNSVLSEITTTSSIINSARDYAHNDLWNAKDGESLTYYLSKGDIVLYDGGERLLRLLDADDVYNVVQNDQSKSGLLFGCFNPFPARNMFIFAPLEECGLEEYGAWIKLADSGSLNTMAFDESKIIDVIEIDKSIGNVRTASEIEAVSDLTVFDNETKSGDYVFARFAEKGQLQELIVYRFI